MKFYVIKYENGEVRHGEFRDYADALNYAESRTGGWDFEIKEYDDYENYEDE